MSENSEFYVWEYSEEETDIDTDEQSCSSYDRWCFSYSGEWDDDNPPQPPEKRLKVNKASIDLKDKVRENLEKVVNFSSAKFTLSGELRRAPLVVISIENRETELHFPLRNKVVESIIDTFEQSPYGLGTETVIDTNVRNCRELNPERFRILNPNWDVFIKEELLTHIKEEMSIETEFSASLYKLLLYESGSFFKPHRDTEKVPGMFATLVIQLPSNYSGGQLVVKHDGKSDTIDFSSTNNNIFSTFFSVFYCDCQHEILKVTEGTRVCLIYNLVANETNIPAPPCTSAEERELVTLFQLWKSLVPLKPTLLVFVLTHSYTQLNLSFESLKTTDRAVANLLKHLSEEHSLTLYLGILKMKDNAPDRDHEDCAPPTYRMTHLMSIKNEVAKGELEDGITVYYEKDVIGSFPEIEPFKYQNWEYLGNSGTHKTLYYRTAALVFWPEDNLDRVLSRMPIHRCRKKGLK